MCSCENLRLRCFLIIAHRACFLLSPPAAEGVSQLEGVAASRGLLCAGCLHCPQLPFQGLWNLPQSLQDFCHFQEPFLSQRTPNPQPPTPAIKSFVLGPELWWRLFLRFLLLGLPQAFAWDSRKPIGSGWGRALCFLICAKATMNALPTMLLGELSEVHMQRLRAVLHRMFWGILALFFCILSLRSYSSGFQCLNPCSVHASFQLS